MPKLMRHVYILAIIILGIIIGQPLAQLTEPGVDRIVNALVALTTAPGQSTTNMRGSLVQCRGQNAEQTAVTNGQNIDAACDLLGRLVTSPYANKDNWIWGSATATSTGSTSVIAAAAGSLRNCILGGVVSNSGGTNDAIITIQDGSGGSALAYVPAPKSYGGATFTLPTPICGTAATATYFAASQASTTVYVTLVGFKAS